MSKPKLHELLAVESSLSTQATKCRAGLEDTFHSKRHLFEEKTVTFTPDNAEDGGTVTESQSDIQSSVSQELKWVQPFIVKALDASYQVADANTRARADVVLDDGTVILTDIPATALLDLEKRMNEISSLVKSIPTLDPAKGFTMDPTRNFYAARVVKKNRSRKEKVVIVKYEATDKHPAQTELIDKDVKIGTITEQEWSGLITPVEKAAIIDRVEIISRAIRRARSRANEVLVDTDKKVGAKLLDYIFKS